MNRIKEREPFGALFQIISNVYYLHDQFDHFYFFNLGLGESAITLSPKAFH